MNNAKTPAFPQPYLIKTALGQDVPIPGMTKLEYLAAILYEYYIKVDPYGEDMPGLKSPDEIRPNQAKNALHDAQIFFVEAEKFLNDGATPGQVKLTTV